MSLASDIITAAHREGNLIPLGNVPTAAEQAEGLLKLNRFIGSVYGQEMGEKLTDWLFPAPQRTAALSADFPQLPFPIDVNGDIWPLPFTADPTFNITPYPPANSRIVFGNVTGTVWLPEQPTDGARISLVGGSGAGDGGANGQILTIDANGRTIQGVNTKAFTAPVAAQRWFYRADTGDWTLIADLLSSDTMPFPTELDDFFITGLAIRLAPSFGKTVSTDTATEFKRLRLNFKTRYRQKAKTVYGSSDFPRSLQSTANGRWGR